MPRDIPVGNGQMLVTFDHDYQVRDLYFPHIGQENHAGGGPCRFGVWGELPGAHGDRRRQRLFWSDQGWDIHLAYQKDTMVTDVQMRHEQLQLEMRCADVVDFHRPVLVRKIEVVNLANQERDVHLFHHNDFNMYGTKVGDTAYYDPQLRCLIYADGDQQIHEYATGTSGFRGAEGTWRDAEDGSLGNNPIAQGAVDSTMMLQVRLPAGGSRTVYLVLGAGHNYQDMEALHQFLHREGPQGVIERTTAYWRLWLTASRVNFGDDPTDQGLSPQLVDLFRRSLLVVRTQIDNGGAIIAANDSDIMHYARDTYSYLWPRDGALVADALDMAGFPDVARSFFSFCSRIISEQGFMMHKYNPDGSAASSWHPWVSMGHPQLPIQEDETSLVIWALWRHYERYRDIEAVRPLWVGLIRSAGDFLLRFRDPDTLLPLPSYDLWEERWGVHGFTVATVYGGLQAAYHFAECFGDHRRAVAYKRAAEETREAFNRYFWSEQHGHYLRRIVPLDHERTTRLMGEVLAGRTPQSDTARPYAPLHSRANGNGNGNGSGHNNGHDGKPCELQFERDAVIDSSLYAIFAMGMLDVHDPRVEKTMQAIRNRLWVKTAVGGTARYEDDYYHRVSDDIENVPGNPWFICTLWLADWLIAKADSEEELREAVPIIEWVAQRALPSNVLAEQVHPMTNAPLSVSPLTWSHATVVATLTSYLDKLHEMRHCQACGQALTLQKRIMDTRLPVAESQLK